MKRSIGVSPFQLVYGVEVVFPSHLAIPVAKFLQDHQEEPDDMIIRIHQLVEVQQAREQVMGRIRDHHQRIKQVFDKNAKKEEFWIGDLVLKWDAPKQDKGKHRKFEALWIEPFKVSKVFSSNTYRLWYLKDREDFNGPMNGHFLKRFFS
jgi:hypothetical protein